MAQNLFKLDDYLALLKHSERNPIIYQRKLITAMNTPVKMKLFLDYYPNTDLNELIPGNSELYQQRTPLTIFDRLLKMEIHYYKILPPFPIKFEPDFTSTYLNNQTANILYLFQKLILNKAKVKFNNRKREKTSNIKFLCLFRRFQSLSMVPIIRITVFHFSSRHLVSIFLQIFVFVT